jgi:hypothetical protein
MFKPSTALAINIVGVFVCALAAYLNFQDGNDAIGVLMVGFTAMNSALAAINWTRL